MRCPVQIQNRSRIWGRPHRSSHRRHCRYHRCNCYLIRLLRRSFSRAFGILCIDISVTVVVFAVGAGCVGKGFAFVHPRAVARWVFCIDQTVAVVVEPVVTGVGERNFAWRMGGTFVVVERNTGDVGDRFCRYVYVALARGGDMSWRSVECDVKWSAEFYLKVASHFVPFALSVAEEGRLVGHEFVIAWICCDEPAAFLDGCEIGYGEINELLEGILCGGYALAAQQVDGSEAIGA